MKHALQHVNWWFWGPAIGIVYLMVIGTFMLFMKGSSIREYEERIEKNGKEESQNDQRRKGSKAN